MARNGAEKWCTTTADRGVPPACGAIVTPKLLRREVQVRESALSSGNHSAGSEPVPVVGIGVVGEVAQLCGLVAAASGLVLRRSANSARASEDALLIVFHACSGLSVMLCSPNYSNVHVISREERRSETSVLLPATSRTSRRASCRGTHPAQPRRSHRQLPPRRVRRVRSGPHASSASTDLRARRLLATGAGECTGRLREGPVTDGFSLDRRLVRPRRRRRRWQAVPDRCRRRRARR